MPDPNQNLISSDVEIKGTVTFGKDLIADGKIEGEILSSGTLTVGHNGNIIGDIYAAHVSIYGQVKGNITAEQRCELKNEAELIGDLVSPRVIIEEGATFVGRSTVTKDGTVAAASAKKEISK